MKTFEEAEYSSIIDHVALTSSEIEQTVKEFKLSFLSNRHEKVEWELDLPPFIIPFYKVLNKYKIILNQLDYVSIYHSYYKDYFNENNFAQDIKTGIEARLLRTYPSLIRDLHFTYFAHEKLENAKVTYNTHLDFHEGIDLMIKYNHVYTAFLLYTETEKAADARIKKGFRHKNFTNVVYEELPVKMTDRKKVGDFFLYDAEELKKVQERIIENSLLKSL
jgi:hypothetical protein